MSGFPFKKDGGIGFWLEKDDEGEDEAGDNEGDPFCPTPGDEGVFAYEATYDWAEDGTHESCVGEDGKHVHSLHGTPQIGYGSSSAGQGCRAEEACDEAESELSANIRGERRCHDEDHVEGEGCDVDRISSDRFGDGTCEESACPETD